ncbi:fungal-specific transcription factor domain-containing protein [Aspergillus multicolor]|uniref:Zn(II)2Cys6 transcription factor n=1 Tax=Aspergillus multicolor TaxID=41759 RepID=UPI003CCE36A6
MLHHFRRKQQRPEPIVMVRSCEFCRRRKIRCDAAKPTCATCRSSNRACVYHNGPHKQRPSAARIDSLESEKVALEETILRLKGADDAERSALLESVTVQDGRVSLPMSQSLTGQELLPVWTGHALPTPQTGGNSLSGATVRGEEDPSANDSIFSSTSVVHARRPMQAMALELGEDATEALRYQLVATAAMERQQEHRLRGLTSIRGIPADLVLHLLDLHWSRQHHTFLLTYRPTFMRELEHGGPYCSDLLLYTVFACASKFSERPGPETGEQFFSRCDKLLLSDGLLVKSSVPTVISLTMLGSTFIARGMTSKGWLYTGYAMRMIYDLDLHTEANLAIDKNNIEEIEIRRRVFWGAFVCEKLQSLYLGRPPTIRLQDARVPQEFLDTFEELEPWQPYDDEETSSDFTPSLQPPAHSVSVFKQLCLLSHIMAQIIDKVYSISITPADNVHEVHSLDEALISWYRELPAHLIYEPWANESPPTPVAPNRIILLTTYHSLTILLHRPFVSVRTDTPVTARTSSPTPSWQRCTAAAEHITTLALSYQSIYPLRKSSYLLSYAVYVACTIHVLNTASRSSGGDANIETSNLLNSSLACLDALAVPNSGAADVAGIIRRLMAAKNIREASVAAADPAPAPALNPVSATASGWSGQLLHGGNSFERMEHMYPFQDISGSLGLLDQELLFGFMNENIGIPITGFDMDESAP